MSELFNHEQSLQDCLSVLCFPVPHAFQFLRCHKVDLGKFPSLTQLTKARASFRQQSSELGINGEAGRTINCQYSMKKSQEGGGHRKLISAHDRKSWHEKPSMCRGRPPARAHRKPGISYPTPSLAMLGKTGFAYQCLATSIHRLS